MKHILIDGQDYLCIEVPANYASLTMQHAAVIEGYTPQDNNPANTKAQPSLLRFIQAVIKNWFDAPDTSEVLCLARYIMLYAYRASK